MGRNVERDEEKVQCADEAAFSLDLSNDLRGQRAL
jgi:hypothetical protein